MIRKWRGTEMRKWKWTGTTGTRKWTSIGIRRWRGNTKMRK